MKYKFTSKYTIYKTDSHKWRKILKANIQKRVFITLTPNVSGRKRNGSKIIPNTLPQF